MMPHSQSSTFLRWVLAADATTCIATGLLLTLGSGYLTGPLGVPAAILTWAGVGLFPFAAFLIYLATRETVRRPGVWLAIGLNVLWVVDSFVLAFGGWIEPTTLGVVFVVAQALAVAAFAEVEYFALRRATVATA